MSTCTTTLKGMHPALKQAVLKSGVRYTSGVRTRSCQAFLYRTKPGLAAPPGKSEHEDGEAVDIHMADVPKFLAWLARNPEYGRKLFRPMSYEPWHFQLKSAASTDRTPGSGGTSPGGGGSSSSGGVSLGSLLEGETWLRVGEAIGGILLLAAGVVLLAGGGAWKGLTKNA